MNLLLESFLLENSYSPVLSVYMQIKLENDSKINNILYALQN